MFDFDLLSERARVTPDKLALVSVETGERLTYGELNERAEHAAATLREVLEPGDRFGLLAHNGIEFLELFFGAGKAGVIVVPLSTRATEHELRVIANDCGMKALFYGPEFADALRDVVGCRSVRHRGESQTTDHRHPTTTEDTYALL
jgi:fatty-acyl-CoA synthase